MGRREEGARLTLVAALSYLQSDDFARHSLCFCPLWRATRFVAGSGEMRKNKKRKYAGEMEMNGGQEDKRKTERQNQP
jgi:hypothetical protein